MNNRCVWQNTQEQPAENLHVRRAHVCSETIITFTHLDLIRCVDRTSSITRIHFRNKIYSKNDQIKPALVYYRPGSSSAPSSESPPVRWLGPVTRAVTLQWGQKVFSGEPFRATKRVLVKLLSKSTVLFRTRQPGGCELLVLHGLGKIEAV